MKLPKEEIGIFPNSMAYARWGTGPRHLILIPGGPGNAMAPGWLLRVQMKPFASLLKDGFSLWLVMRKQNMAEGYRVEDIAKDYGELIEQEFDGSVDTVVGISFGGMIGFHLAADYGHMIGKMAIIVAAATVTDCEYDIEFARLIAAGKKVEGNTFLLKTLYPQYSLLAPILSRLIIAASPKEVHPHFAKDIVTEARTELTYDASECLSRISIPMLLLNGDKDNYFPIDAVKDTVSQLPNCTSIIYSGKGHFGAGMDKRCGIDTVAFVRTFDTNV
ncbi:MAG: alpha/beta hydrolase [Pseudomonadota bacterium]